MKSTIARCHGEIFHIDVWGYGQSSALPLLPPEDEIVTHRYTAIGVERERNR